MNRRFWKRLTGLAWLQAQYLRWRVFTPQALLQVAENIRAGEAGHAADVVLAVESTTPRQVRHPRQRALEVFGRLRVWDTPGNTGVLLYLSLDRGGLEIIADRGVPARDQDWLAVCQQLQQRLRAGDALPGVLEALDAMHAILREACPRAPGALDAALDAGDNALPDAPVLL